MSRETIEWLNRNVLVGAVKARGGKAWHWRAAAQEGMEPNHYDDVIPVADVERRLFDWEALERPVAVNVAGEDEAPSWAVQGDRKAIIASDTLEVLGMFKQGYQPHQYREWLLTNVATILDDDLGITSAGLLRNRAVAWVEVSVPDSITTPEGVEFRPNLLASTSFDGTVATQYGRTVTATVCDNTHQRALAEGGQKIKAKHTKRSLDRIADVREALALVHTTADEFAAEVAALCDATVTDDQWGRFLLEFIPDPETKKGKTQAQTKRGELDNLWRFDARVSPWAGSAYGVLAAANTWHHHLRPTRGETQRAERSMLDVIDGTTEANDARALKVLAGITG